MGRLDGSTPEVEVGAFVDGVRRDPSRHEELVALLPENVPLYDGRSGPEVTRLRGYLLAAFSDISLPVSALTYVLEVLESSYECYEVAGAAIGLRGFKTPIDVAPYLFRAIDNLAGADAVVSFETYNPRWPYSVPTTALTEVIRTLALPGITSSSYAGQIEALASQRERFSAAVVAELQAALSAVNAAAVPEPEYSCCDDMAFIERFSAQPAAASGSGVVLEDQEGRRGSFGEFFRGKPSVVAFFYTRCDNPNKCSLTVTKLAALQDALAGRGLDGAVKLAAITYDPEFDLPHRLKLYGADRGVRFDADTRFFRTTAGFADLASRFSLGVNYSASTVNRHQIEVHVLDSDGNIAASFTRLQWQVGEVLSAIEPLLETAS